MTIGELIEILMEFDVHDEVLTLHCYYDGNSEVYDIEKPVIISGNNGIVLTTNDFYDCLEAALNISDASYNDIYDNVKVALKKQNGIIDLTQFD